MDIKQIPGQSSQQQVESGKAKNGGDVSSHAHPGQQSPNIITSSEDKVVISNQAGNLQKTLESLNSVADINSDKVASIKSAIEAGTFSIDSASIADKLVNFELSFSE